MPHKIETKHETSISMRLPPSPAKLHIYINVLHLHSILIPPLIIYYEEIILMITFFFNFFKKIKICCIILRYYRKHVMLRWIYIHQRGTEFPSGKRKH